MARKSARTVPTKATSGRGSKTPRGSSQGGRGRTAPASKKGSGSKAAAKRAARVSRTALEAVRDAELRRRSEEPARQDEPRREAGAERAEAAKPAREAEVGSQISPGIAEAGPRAPMSSIIGNASSSAGLPFPSIGPAIPFPGLPMAGYPIAPQQLGLLNFEAAVFFARRSAAVTEGLLQLMRCRTLPDVLRVQTKLILDALADLQKLTMRLAKPTDNG